MRRKTPTMSGETSPTLLSALLPRMHVLRPALAEKKIALSALVCFCADRAMCLYITPGHSACHGICHAGSWVGARARLKSLHTALPYDTTHRQPHRYAVSFTFSPFSHPSKRSECVAGSWSWSASPPPSEAAAPRACRTSLLVLFAGILHSAECDSLDFMLFRLLSMFGMPFHL